MCQAGRKVPTASVHHQGPDTQLPTALEGTQGDKGRTPWPTHAHSTEADTFQVQSIIQPQ